MSSSNRESASSSDAGTLSAQEAAARLGVKLETLYAYVSRGWLARAGTGGRRSRFFVADIDRLASRGRRAPAAQRPTSFLVETQLTKVEEGAILYRGRSAAELAARWPFERVAHWLWSGESTASPPGFLAQPAAAALARVVCSSLPEQALPLERLRVIAVVLGSTDPVRYQISPSAVMATARALLGGLVDSLPLVGQRPRGDSLAARLWPRLGPTPARPSRLRALDAALGLCADHALSPSTLAVRVAAAQRADPYAIVQTGMGALHGALHGAASLLAEELLAEVEAGRDPGAVVGARLQRAERIPGFGHALHPQGDPRALALLELVPSAAGNAAAVRASRSVLEVMHSRGLPAPNVDFALATLARACRMERGGSEAIMAVARVAGWLAHALEEYERPTRFPMRALYVGRAG